MKTMRRSIILKTAAEAYELGLDVMSGRATRDENGRWLIDRHVLDEWLQEHEGEDLVLILGSLEDNAPVQTRTCQTCGRDYTDLECPYCRASRIRLRGEP
jgi:hypothetical protein